MNPTDEKKKKRVQRRQKAGCLLIIIILGAAFLPKLIGTNGGDEREEEIKLNRSLDSLLQEMGLQRDNITHTGKKELSTEKETTPDEHFLEQLTADIEIAQLLNNSEKARSLMMQADELKKKTAEAPQSERTYLIRRITITDNGRTLVFFQKYDMKRGISTYDLLNEKDNNMKAEDFAENK